MGLATGARAGRCSSLPSTTLLRQRFCQATLELSVPLGVINNPPRRSHRRHRPPPGPLPARHGCTGSGPSACHPGPGDYWSRQSHHYLGNPLTSGQGSRRTCKRSFSSTSFVVIRSPEWP